MSAHSGSFRRWTQESGDSSLTSPPHGESVNDGIAKELCSLSYVMVDDIATRVLKLGRGVLVAKFDLKAAYRHILVHPDDRRLLGMEWKGGLYLDAALHFGLR